MEAFQVLKFIATEYGKLLYGKRPIPCNSTVLKGVQLPHAPLEDKHSGGNWYPDEVGGPFGFPGGDTTVYFRRQRGIIPRIINALHLGYIGWLEKADMIRFDNVRVFYPVQLLGFDVEKEKYVDIRENPGESVVPLSGDLERLKEFIEAHEKN